MISLPSVHVAIVNWNTAAAAVASADAYLRSEGVRACVTIIDNRSAEPERELLRRRCPAGVELVLNDRNLGYGAAANAVLRGAAGDAVCVSNADLLPDAAMLRRLVDCAFENEDAGLAGPALGDCYHVRLPRPGWLLLKPLVGRAGLRFEQPPRDGEVVEVEQPAGACIVARTSVWRDLDGFDERFFLWFEDVDLAKRAHDAGYRNFIVGDALATHQEAAAFVQIAPGVGQYLRIQSLRRYTSKHYPRLATPMRLASALALCVRGARRGAAGAAELRGERAITHGSTRCDA